MPQLCDTNYVCKLEIPNFILFTRVAATECVIFYVMALDNGKFFYIASE